MPTAQKITSLADRVRALQKARAPPADSSSQREAMQRDRRGRRDVEAVEARRHGDADSAQPRQQLCGQAFAFGAEEQRQPVRPRHLADVAARRRGDSAIMLEAARAASVADEARRSSPNCANGILSTAPTETRIALR